MILNKEHKVVLFPPGFQTVRNPPGVKRDPPSLSFSRVPAPFLRPYPPGPGDYSFPPFPSPCLFASPVYRSFPIAGAETTPRSLLMLQIQFLLSPADHCPEERGKNRRRGCAPEREIVSLSLAIVRVTAREIQNLSAFFLSFFLSHFEFEEKASRLPPRCTHASL